MTGTIIVCPKCRIQNNLELSGPRCWKCHREFSVEEMVVPEPACEQASSEADDRAKVLARNSLDAKIAGGIGVTIALAIIIVPIILLLSYCSDQRAQTRQAEGARLASEDAGARILGTQCLSAWDGSHPTMVSAVKQRLRDPSSFEHVETRTSPMDVEGKHVLIMQFRAENGFGGKNVGFAKGILDGRTCVARVEQVSD